MKCQNKIKKTFFLLLAFMVALNSFAQSGQGRNFYVAFARDNEKPVNEVELKLRVVTTVATTVTLSFTSNSNLNHNLTIPAGTVYDYTLTPAEKSASYTTGLMANTKTIKVTASAPIVLYASNCSYKSVDITRILPEEDWGKEYYKNTSNNSVILIAKENNTIIDFILNGSTSFSRTLQAGEMLFSPGPIYVGTKIVSNNKDFAFFENALQGSSLQFAQLFPITHWGLKFIVPPDIYNNYNARIIASQITNVNIYYTDGTTESAQLNPQFSSNRYKDIVNGAGIPNDPPTQTPKRACYVVADKPVGVCVFLEPSTNPGIPSMSPAETWLPPVDQPERNVMIKPFSFNTTYLFGITKHYAIIITPVAGKENTTVSINGEFPQILNHPMTWVANNVGNSGYSIARYELGDNKTPAAMNSTYKFDNPNGVIVLAYGNDNNGGSYFCTPSGSGSVTNLPVGFTVNGISCFNVNGTVYNSGTSFLFSAFPNTLSNIKWVLNGTEIAGSFNQNNVSVNDLPDGYYTLTMTALLGSDPQSISTFFYVGNKQITGIPNGNNANQGTRFYVAFAKVDTITTVKKNIDQNAINHNVELILRMTASETTDVTLSFTENQTLNTTFSIPGGITDYVLSYERACAAYSGLSSYPNRMKKTILITTSSPITLHAISTCLASVEATMVFPVENWGKEYTNVSLPADIDPNLLPDTYAAGYIVIADEDNTKIDFTRDNLSGFPNYTRILNKGEVEYMFLPGPAGGLNSMSQLHIRADKPVGYFEINTKAVIDTNRIDCILDNSNITSHTFEQMAPLKHWGKKFILPTGTTGSNLIRITANDASAVVNIYYMDGTNDVISLEGWNNHCKDICLSGTRNSAYIVSNKPICIATYHLSGMQQGELLVGMQPGEAWLPPVEQRVHNVLVSPLDLNGSHIFHPMRHAVVIITPTSGRENTTVSINGEPPQTLNHPMTWIADNIRGSGYSFARYYLGANKPGEHLNTTFRFDNPNGVLVLAYGQGSYANYYYAAGYGGYDFSVSFTVDDIPSAEVDGKYFCKSDYIFDAIIPPSFENQYIKWFFNGIEDQNGRGLIHFPKTLSPGVYEVKLRYEDTDGFIDESTTTFTVNQASTLTRSGGDASQTVCQGSAINDIVYTRGGSATGVSISWSPTTPTGINFNSASGTISGSPTVFGTYTYTVTTTGHTEPCTAVTATGTITVKAQGPPCLPTITYDPNGGIGDPIVIQKTDECQLILAPNNDGLLFHNPGFEFVEWNTNSDGTGDSYLPGSEYCEDENLILYAIWKRDCNTPPIRIKYKGKKR